ncbi:MAG: TetR/AcrR family transcriptional regulator [Solirubrobacteraceae bacterium]
MPELPLVDPDTVERVDAARNRERILCAARRLFDARGVSCVSMDDVAAAAGVGKGTLFRRFGSRAALAHAVLDESERAQQEAVIRGAPPLGPGAPARERLIAFGHARLDLLEKHIDLLVAAEDRGARFNFAPYGMHRLHISLLLREADPECDSELLAETLLAYFGADLFVHLKEVRGMSLERIKAGWEQTVARLIPAA